MCEISLQPGLFSLLIALSSKGSGFACALDLGVFFGGCFLEAGEGETKGQPLFSQIPSSREDLKEESWDKLLAELDRDQDAKLSLEEVEAIRTGLLSRFEAGGLGRGRGKREVGVKGAFCRSQGQAKSQAHLW